MKLRLAATFSLLLAATVRGEDAPSDISVERGKETYAMFCAACHGPEGNSVESPSNLFDTDWYHGGSRDEVGKTIREGIMEKGMPGWGQMISNEEIESVIAYLFSFQTTESSTNE